MANSMTMIGERIVRRRGLRRAWLALRIWRRFHADLTLRECWRGAGEPTRETTWR